MNADALASLGFLELLGLSALVFSSLTLVSLAFGAALERSLQQKGRKVFDVAKKPHQTRREVIGNVLFLLLWCPCLALVLDSGWLRFGPGVARELITFLGCLTAFQAFYWLFHRAMHWRPLFFIHRWHHQSLVTGPLTGFSMRPLEGVGWTVGFLGPALVASTLTPIGLWGFTAFLAYAWYGNIVGHVNAEIMPPLSTTKWGSRLFANPVSYHCLHHARFNGHYGFGAAWGDAIFGTQYPDWREVALRVHGGKALTEIAERRD